MAGFSDIIGHEQIIGHLKNAIALDKVSHAENQVKITYKPLWKLLIDRDMTKTELRKKTQIAPSTFTKMNNDQQVSLDILARICVELKCGFDDIVEIER